MNQAAPVGIHVPDAQWLIALWVAIHGGDPAPNDGIVSEAAAREAAIGIIAAVAPYASAASSASADILAKLGVAVEPPAACSTPDKIEPFKCFSTGYGRYCVNDPPPSPREF